MARMFWRIVRGPTPTLDDFRPNKELGKPLRDPAMHREWASGVSVYDSLDHATARVRIARYRLGRWLAAIAVPEDEAIEVVQSGRDEHHFTLYSSPEQLLRLVTGSTVYVWDERHEV